MPDSITLKLPTARRALVIITKLAGFSALLLIGALIGSRLLAPDAISTLATPGAVQQVRVNSGSVYLGRIVSSGGEYLRLADPAIIRQGDTAADASPGPRLVVEALAVEPYDTHGELVIPITSVEWVTNIRPGSDLEAAYSQVTSTVPAAPRPTSSP